MKKVTILLSLLMIATLSFAQKSNVSKAKNKALASENPDFSGARELIKPALTDGSTKDLANTWYVAGLIGAKENEEFYKKLLTGAKVDEDKKGQAIVESYHYFLVADSLGQLPDDKGRVRNRVRKDIKTQIKDYYVIPSNLIAYGAYLYDKKDYAEAYKVFDVFTEIPSLPLIENEIPLDSTFYMIQYYKGLAASNAKMHDKAIAVYEDLKDKDYESLTVYQLLYEEYSTQKDTVKFVQTLKDGFTKFPKEAWFLQNLINYYIYSNQTEEALLYLNNAVENEPGIAQYRYVKGVIEEQLGNLEDAHASFDKAIELDPDYADAYAGKGRLIFNAAVKITEDASNIRDNRKYNAEIDRADEVFKESLPYLKKAVELAPDDIEHKRTLRTLYYRLGMDAEYEAINNEINAQ